MPSFRFLTLLFAMLVGCGAGGPTGGTDPGGSGSPPGSTGGGAGSGGNPGNGGSTGGTDPGGRETVTISMPQFAVPAGSEMFKCIRVKNPFGGRDVDVAQWDAQLIAGSHHSFLFFDTSNTDGALEDCSGLTFSSYAFATQQAQSSYAFPQGTAVRIPQSLGFRMIVHMLNATSQTVMAGVSYTAHLAPSGSVQQHAGAYFFNNAFIFIPSDGQQHTVNQQCSFPQNVNLLSLQSHMHKHATNFIATSAGKTLFTTTQWNEPPASLFDPAFALPASQQISYTCTYVNNTGATLTFGESAATNEMCIMAGFYFPVMDINNPTLGCLL